MNLEGSQVLARIFQTALNLRITFYDASYLIAALVTRAVLVTADRKLLGRLEGQKDSLLLLDWKSPVRKTSRKSERGERASFPSRLDRLSRFRIRVEPAISEPLSLQSLAWFLFVAMIRGSQ